MTVYIARGIVYYDMGNYPLALQDFTQAFDIDNKNAEALFRMGLCKLKERSYKDAIEMFDDALTKQALNDGEKNPGIQDGLGTAYENLGEYGEALRYYEEARWVLKNNDEP